MINIFQPKGTKRRFALWFVCAFTLVITFCRLAIAESFLQLSNEATVNKALDLSSQPETLRLGGYVKNISDIDLKGDTFMAELLIWTVWSGPSSDNPSSQLSVLNSVLGQGSGLERIRTETTSRGEWSLYRLRSQIVQRWHLRDYPFDSQTLHIEIGLIDPLSTIAIEVDEKTQLQVSPGLQIDGWIIGDASEYATYLRYLTDLGKNKILRSSFTDQRIISFDLELTRDSILYVAPDFLGYFLTIGLCSLSLVISRSRDDLMLAAVVSSSGNYVFIAEKLPVSAMNGFVGNLQIILIAGILYAIIADEVIGQHLKHYTPRMASLLRYGLLPSYLIGTFIAIILVIP